MKRCFIKAGKAGKSLSACLVIGLMPVCDKKPTGNEPPAFDANLYNLRLTEINYNPGSDNSGSGNGPEFIELKNIGSTTLSLKNLEITSGVTYVFPSDATLEPGAFLVLAADSAAFHQRYGFAPDGIYTGALSNSGETIIIKDMLFDSTIISQTYADAAPWPPEADGKGYSIVPVKANPDRGSTGPAAWRRSVRPGGSPKADDIRKEADPVLFNLRITEIHYHPLDLDGVDGDSLEFIELKNIGSVTLDLGTVEFTSGITYAFPSDAKLEANGFIVLVKDPNTFQKSYPSVKPFGTYAGNLANSGEKISIADVAADTQLVTVDYKDSSPWPVEADSTGYSLVPVKRNPDANQDNPAAWRRSFNINGSPGADDPGIVVINEVLTHTDPPLYDAVELFNPGGDSVNIGGWYLTDDRRNPMKFRIPDNTIIPPAGYVYFDEKDFNAADDPSAFTFNSHGEEAWIMADKRGCLFGYCHGCRFGELENGLSIGRHITSDGREVFAVQKERTLGKENAGPLVGPLVISEIMYHSADNEGDYLVVANISGEEIAFSHSGDFPAHTWKISGIGFSFPPGKAIKPGEKVVIATDTITESAFRIRYTVPKEVQVFQMAGNLKNGEELLKLQKPQDPYVDSSLTPADTMIFPFMIVDEVEYSDKKPWPADADGGGKSLHRDLKVYGNDPAAWKAGNPRPGWPD